MKYIQWAIYWLPLFIIGQLARLISPIACLFVVRITRFDTVKRLGKKKVSLARDTLIPQLSWFNTHDNDTSEWWYGMYNVGSFKFARDWTQADYDGSKLIRWFCRVMWLQRNSAYGFSYAYFSKPVEDVTKTYEYGNEASAWWLLLNIRKSSFQLELHHPLWMGKYNSVNIGWKSHNGMPKMLYAGRILGIRDK